MLTKTKTRRNNHVKLLRSPIRQLSNTYNVRRETTSRAIFTGRASSKQLLKSLSEWGEKESSFYPLNPSKVNFKIRRRLDGRVSVY